MPGSGFSAASNAAGTVADRSVLDAGHTAWRQSKVLQGPGQEPPKAWFYAASSKEQPEWGRVVWRFSALDSI